jgi:two-component system, chemotaxis family, protein-glutamate methylesterase/glutaminase
LGASVFVVLHIGSGREGQSKLPEILTKAGPLPAVHPVNGAEIEKGKIYIAPPDQHLLVESTGHLQLSHGPKENRTRPAINPLFRSAAAAYRERVIGVILTGLLDDGVAGLAEVKRKGGTAVVQDPDTALYRSMPVNALENVDVDYTAPINKLGELLATLSLVEHLEMDKEEPIQKIPTNLTCPECRGPLKEERQGRIREYRCRVGHAYSPLAMASEHEDTIERTLWAAVVALEEAADIAEKVETPHSLSEVISKRGQAATIREMLYSAKK